MVKTTNIRILLLILFACCAIQAEELNFTIRYLGLKVVDVKMTDQDKMLTVLAKTTGIGDIAGEMDNTYTSCYLGDYLPFSYSKKILQKDYQENRLTIYSRDTKTAIRESFVDKQRSKDYEIHPESRDFFSALFYIRHNIKKNSTLYLDANGLIWEAYCRIDDKEKLKTLHGEKITQKIVVSFKKVSTGKKDRSDMLTNNLVNEENDLTLWIGVDDQHLPYKASYNMKPFPVYWILERYEE